MYKAGKQWLTALVTVAAVSLLGVATTAHAATTTNQTGSQPTATVATSTAVAASNGTTVTPNSNSDATPVNNACLDGISSNQQGDLVLSGWHASSVYQPGTQHYLLVLNAANNQEMYRTPATVINRPDVQAVYPHAAIAGNGGFQATIPTARLAGADSYRIISRYTTLANGEPSGNQDFWFPAISSKAGCLDSFKVTGSQITAGGWHAADASALLPNHYLILFDQTLGREIGRKKVVTTASTDVAQNGFGNIANADHARFSATFNLSQAELGHRLVLVSRYSDDASYGEGHHVDQWFNNIIDLHEKQAAWLDTLALRRHHFLIH